MRSPRDRSLPLTVRRHSVPHLALIGIGLLICAAVILWGGDLDPFDQGQLTRVMIYAIAIAGLNVATGYTGMISVGHSAFFGLGAYTTGVLVVKYGWHAEATIPVALGVCFVAGLIVGLPALRIRGLYLAMVTLAFGVAFPERIDRFADLTGGSVGLTIRRTMLRPPDWSGFRLGEKGQWLYWLSAAVLVVVMLVVHNLMRSRYGLALIAARDNEIAAAASGVNLAVVKTVAFGVSGALTGLGGSLFAMFLGSLVADDSFTLLSAIALLTGLVIGGQATRFGPIVGGVAVVYIPYYTSDIGQGQASGVLFGAALILLIFLAPEGLTGGFFRLFDKVFRIVPRPPRPMRPDWAAPTTAATVHPPSPETNSAPEAAPRTPMTAPAEPIGGDLT
jgi:branched-chain amino acid transport system permease protein